MEFIKFHLNNFYFYCYFDECFSIVFLQLCVVDGHGNHLDRLSPWATFVDKSFVEAVIYNQYFWNPPPAEVSGNYRKTSSISRTKSQNLNVSNLVVQLLLLNLLKPCVKLRMKM